MQTASPSLLPIFRSRSLARILAHLFLHEDERFSLSALARRLGIAPSTVHREIDQLERAGIVASERWGNLRLVRANPESPYFRDLQLLLLTAFGPLPVLGELLREIAEIKHAYIFGSWASRYLDQAGPPAADIDVLIVGDPDPEQVDAACAEAGERLGREVNAMMVSDKSWREGSTGFIRTVRSRPLVEILIEREPAIA